MVFWSCFGSSHFPCLVTHGVFHVEEKSSEFSTSNKIIDKSWLVVDKKVVLSIRWWINGFSGNLLIGRRGPLEPERPFT